MAPKSERCGLKTTPLGKEFVGFCVVRKKELRYRQNGQPYLVWELGDWSGRLKARWWNRVEQMERQIPVGAVVKLKGIPQMCNGVREMKLIQIRRKKETEDVDIRQLLPSVNKDVDRLKRQFYGHIDGIRNQHLRTLLHHIFSRKDFAERYFLTPAGKLWHHVYLYGLLDHVVGMLNIAQVLGNNDPELNLDLLKCGIVLHDIGKIWELDLGRGFIDYTDEGRLIGHVVKGYVYVEKQMRQVSDFPPSLWIQLGHLILSHPGDVEKGAPVPPMTREAMALSLINQLDGQLNALHRILQYDLLPGSRWSKFIPLLGRFIHVGHPAEQHHQSEDQK